MKLWYDKKAKDPCYFAQLGIRNGKKTTTKNIARIGKHSELLKITSDPLTYAKQQVEKISEDYKKDTKVALDLRVDFKQKVKYTEDKISQSTRLNIGYFFLQQIYQRLDLPAFFLKACKDSRISFDPNEVNRFLTYARILEPDSKLGTYDNLERYYEKPSIGYQHILRTMDILSLNFDDYINHLYKQSCKIVKRDTSVCYYDCTNYYFETETQDPEYVDDVTGEIIKGLRQYGISKEHRPNPIVEMGLFMDSDGIPISMCIVPGNTNEQKTAIPLEEKMLKMFQGKKFIYCADAGLGSLSIRNFNSMKGRAFVVTQSVKKMSNLLKEAVFNDFDWKLLSNDAPVTIEAMKGFDRFEEENLALYNDRAYKVLSADHAYDLGLIEEVVCKNGKTKMAKSKAVIKQKVIVTFSRKMMEYQRYIRNRQIERAKALLKNLDPISYKKGPNDITRFICKTTGKASTDRYKLDEDAIREEEKYDGYYAIATDLDDPAKDVIDISEQRNKIEDCFRVMKTNLSARPVFHQKQERIIAHFMICYTALLIFRLLQKQIDMTGKHFTTDQLIETLKNMEVVNIEDLCYQSIYTGSEVCSTLEEVFLLGLDRQYYKPKELHSKIRSLTCLSVRRKA